MASIHHKGAEFIRPNYAPNAADFRSKKKHHDGPRSYPWGQPFWASVHGTPAEIRLARMVSVKVRV